MTNPIARHAWVGILGMTTGLLVGCQSQNATRVDSGGSPGMEAGVVEAGDRRDGRVAPSDVPQAPSDVPVAPDASPDGAKTTSDLAFDSARPSFDVPAGLDRASFDTASEKGPTGPDARILAEVGPEAGIPGKDGGLTAGGDGGNKDLQTPDAGREVGDGGPDGAGGASGELTWVLRPTTVAPPERFGPGWTYDKARRKFVLFGGNQDLTHPRTDRLGDTWEWDGETWTQRFPATSPRARNGPGMVYDSRRAKVVLFGGHDGSYYLADTWEWDGETWTARDPDEHPRDRSFSSMAYDSGRGRTVLFGGESTEGYWSETWEWDGDQWTQLSPANVPSARCEAGMAYDTVRSKVVMFGGYGPYPDGPTSAELGDTWEWDGSNWTKRATTTSPSIRRAFNSMVYDAARKTSLLFGGRSFFADDLTDTWEWDGNTWTQRYPASSPTPRHGSAIAQDDTRGVTVLFGGVYMSRNLSDVWEYVRP